MEQLKPQQKLLVISIFGRVSRSCPVIRTRLVVRVITNPFVGLIWLVRFEEKRTQKYSQLLEGISSTEKYLKNFFILLVHV